jgi:hypothetical protein
MKTCSYGPTIKGKTLVHPAALNTEEDFDLMKQKIAEGAEPWASAWKALESNTLAGEPRTPRPLREMIRGGDGENYGRVHRELEYMYSLALRWKISGETKWGDGAVSYLNDWSSVMQYIDGDSNMYLAAGYYGYQFAIIGELMKSYDGWSLNDQQQYKEWLLEKFYPHNHHFVNRFEMVQHRKCVSHYFANWDLSNIAALMAIGIFTDRPDIYQEAMDYLYNGIGNGALRKLMYYRHAGNMGQYQESGRDQGHTTVGVTLYGVIAKMAWNQGDDLFSYNNYQLLATSEYIARYNVDMEQTVPYVEYKNCSTAKNGQSVISSHSRGGTLRPSWALIYNHYQNRLGIAAPWSEKAANQVVPEVPNHKGSEPGWGTLTEAHEAHPLGSPPKGLTVLLTDGNAELSWWGAAGAESYLVKRSMYKRGPYDIIAEIDASELMTYTDENIERDRRYYYHVTALTSGRESRPSNTVRLLGVGELLVYRSFDEETATGVMGNALDLNGTEELALEVGLLENVSDFTIATWLYQDKQVQNARLFDFGIDYQDYLTFSPYNKYDAWSHRSVFSITKTGGYAAENLYFDPLPAKQWTHVAITQLGKTITLYIDGEEVASREIKMKPYQLGKTTRNFLGRCQGCSQGTLDGKIDDFRIYSGALNALEIAGLASPPTY